ncbi:carbamoyltransferase HypF [Spartinivicinus ruber]|uniref:carbamoyltransferase HypF n=1 Tax=Spartinivicinus ruber TaxID=2683272 RepID=UPI0013D6D947|nr:carbamoyltransferase HypF [Spartinivicinus ruber]
MISKGKQINNTSATVRIIGIGNQLHGDDAIAHYALGLLKQYPWPDHVELVDGGIGGVTLTSLFRDCQRVILIDSFKNPHQAGEVVYLTNVQPGSDGADFLSGMTSVEHGGGVKSLLALLPLLVSPLPVIDIFAIGGASFTPFSHGLSKCLTQKLSVVCQQLHQKIIKEYADSTSSSKGILLLITGRVQGVGFRPFVYQLAQEMGLMGDVQNTCYGVEVRLLTTSELAEQFCDRLQTECPDLACIEQVQWRTCTFQAIPNSFQVLENYGKKLISGGKEQGNSITFPADLAVCSTCLTELTDSNNRRYGYPFINCTQCGPRFSIIKALPYDRCRTIMEKFPMCEQCTTEYENPTDRRFHAESIVCTKCGPSIWLKDNKNNVITGQTQELINHYCQWLAAGKILAIKGIGGFQLTCDATNSNAINTLRQRKYRPAKPLAVMMCDLSQATQYFELTSLDKLQLSSTPAPILLLAKEKFNSDQSLLVELLAPDQVFIGVVLAYSPLHWLLLKQFGQPLVMTSGNVRGSPICIDNDQAKNALTDLVDGWLLHNRDILHHCDDSVVKIIANKPRLIRRARGYVSDSIKLPDKLSANNDVVLAFGADLKNTFCLASAGKAMLSAHNGDLSQPDCFKTMRTEVANLQTLLDVKPQAIAVDLHPDYFSSHLGLQLAKTAQLPLIKVQHHHAHLAACLAENEVIPQQPVLGIILDGLGFGDDGTFWGGELLLGDYCQYQRIAHLRPFPLLGGDKANSQPWRNLLSLLAQAGYWHTLSSNKSALSVLKQLNNSEAKLLLHMADNFPQTSSVGRLLDAVAALLEIAPKQLSFEGEAAMKLEAQALAYHAGITDYYLFTVCRNQDYWLLDTTTIWPQMIKELSQGISQSELAAKFQLSLVKGLKTLVIKLLEQEHLEFNEVALSGGVFQNQLILSELIAELSALGLVVYSHSQVPSNDGGIALGQAAIALTKIGECR